MRDLDLEAYHEASHCVVALNLGLSVHLVSVERTVRDGEEQGARTDLVATRDMRWLDDVVEARFKGVVPPEKYALVLNNLILSWAGTVGERIVSRGAPPFWSKRPAASSDAGVALDLARALGVRGGRRARRFVASFEAAARRILVDRWREVQAVAAALLKRGTLDGRELRAVVARAKKRP